MQEFVTIPQDAGYDYRVSGAGRSSRESQTRASDPISPVLLPSWVEERITMKELVHRLWCEQEGQDIAEYAVMLAVILVIVVGTIRLIGSSANNVFSNVASSMQ